MPEKNCIYICMKKIECNPSFGVAYLNLGSILMSRFKYEEALYNLRKAQEHKTNSSKCLAAIGRLLLEQGKHLEGITYLREGAGSIIFDLKNGFSKI